MVIVVKYVFIFENFIFPWDRAFFSLYKISKKLLQNKTKNSFDFWCSEEGIKQVFIELELHNHHLHFSVQYTVKPLNSGHLQVLKNLSVIEKCPLLGGNLKKIVTFGTKCFVRYSWHVGYLECPLLGGFTVFILYLKIKYSIDEK